MFSSSNIPLITAYQFELLCLVGAMLDLRHTRKVKTMTPEICAKYLKVGNTAKDYFYSVATYICRLIVSFLPVYC